MPKNTQAYLAAAANLTGFTIGDTVSINVPGLRKNKNGVVVGYGSSKKNPDCVRVKTDTSSEITTIHRTFLTKL